MKVCKIDINSGLLSRPVGIKCLFVMSMSHVKGILEQIYTPQSEMDEVTTNFPYKRRAYTMLS